MSRPSSQKTSAVMNRKTPKATFTLCIVCIVVTALIHILPLNGNETEKAVMLGAYYRPFVACGEYWRILSSGLIHISWFHLMINLFSLWVLGSAMEQIFGWKKYLILLFASSGAGYLFLFAGSKSAVCVGISGGLYGLLAAYFMIVMRSGGYRIPQVRNSLIELFAINFAINFMPSVAWQVHLGGFLAGLLLSILLSKAPDWKSVRKNAAAAAAIFAIALFAFCTRARKIQPDEIYLLTDSRILNFEKQAGADRHAEIMAERLDGLYGTGSLLQNSLQEGSVYVQES